ncbi:MAG: PQQ-like beta-propeller repeat protein [Gemmataceae bacterium]|nr:PQQ-like beta-propeller repeat protein [Gemmataceae bacterium]
MSCRIASAALLLFVASSARADWPQFRGPGGLGIATDKSLPTAWSDNKNLVWKTELPGPGSSSPIVVGDKIIITCYSGYGVDANDPGKLKNLKRHLLCLDKQGKVLWTRDVAAEAADYPFRSFNSLHGYASSTPTSDGKNVYCFFGVAGVVAFDLAGKQLWQTSVGTGTNDWGTGTSPVLAGDHVIVNAAVENEAVVALDKKTGKIAWSQKGIEYSWTTPLVLDVNGRQEVVVSMYQKIKAYNPKTGAELWTCDGLEDYVCPSLVAADGVVFVIGARQGTAMAVKAGGAGDVSDKNIVWKIRRGSNVSSPLVYEGHLYWAHEGRGMVYCVDAKNGEIKYEENLEPDADKIYASAFLAGGKIYYVSRTQGTYVVDAGPKFKLVQHNRFVGDDSVFDGSPAPLDGRLLLRSNRYVYCIGAR